MKKKKILIFGSSGHIASNLISNLEKKYITHNFTRSKLKKKKLSLKYKNSFFYLFKDLKLLSHYSYEALIFFSGPNDIVCNNNKEKEIRSFLSKMNTLFDKIKKFKLKKIIYFSTAQVYFLNGKINEKSNLQPSNYYGLLRLLTEDFFRYFSKITNIPTVILRPSNIIGDSHFNLDSSNRLLPNQLCNILIKENEFKLNSSGVVYKNFVSIESVIDCVEFFLKKKLKSNIYEFNLGHKNISIYNFSKKVAKIFEKKTKQKKIIIKGSSKDDNFNKLNFSDSKLRKFGFYKRKDFKTKIEEMCNGRIR
jgi:nucleoside-diphosphate-sugar epimerase